MSSNFIFQLRKYSGDELAQRFKNLSELLASFEAHNVQTETLEMTNSIRTDNSIDVYTEQRFTNVTPVSTVFYVPFEPDLKYLTLWFNFEHFGSVVKDHSFNSAGLSGSIVGGDGPIGVLGPSKGMGGVEGSTAMEFDGLTEHLQVNDDPSVSMVNQTKGFSVAILVNIQSFNPVPTTGQARYIAQKVDDPNNMWSLWIDPGLRIYPAQASGFTSGFDQNFVGISYQGFAGYPLHFWIYKNGVSYSITTATPGPMNKNSGILSQDLRNWHWIVITFDMVAGVSMIYIDGIAALTTTEFPTQSPGPTGGFAHAPTSLFVGSNSGSDGFLLGALSDFRYYNDKVLNQFDVYNLNRNMQTISNIPFGQVAVTGLCTASSFDIGSTGYRTPRNFTSNFTNSFH